MINTRLVYLNPKSTSKIATLFGLISSIIACLILVIASTLIYTFVLKDLNISNLPINIPMEILGFILGIVIGLILNYALTYINTIAYNYLIKYFTGIQFELTPHNEIKEIDLMNSTIIVLIISAIWLIISGIITLGLYSIIIMVFEKYLSSLFGSLDIASLTVIPLTVVTLYILLSLVFIAILCVIYIFIFNFFSNRNPVKVEINEENGLELKSIDVISLIMTIGLTTITLQVITSLINVMISGTMEVAILNLINTILISIVITALLGIIYNFLASRVGGIEFDIEPSSNMIQEYDLTKQTDN